MVAKQVSRSVPDSDPQDERHEQANALDRHAQWIV